MSDYPPGATVRVWTPAGVEEREIGARLSVLDTMTVELMVVKAPPGFNVKFSGSCMFITPTAPTRPAFPSRALRHSVADVGLRVGIAK